MAPQKDVELGRTLLPKNIITSGLVSATSRTLEDIQVSADVNALLITGSNIWESNWYWLPAVDCGDGCLNDLGRPLTQPEMGLWWTYTDPCVPTYLTPFSGVDVL